MILCRYKKFLQSKDLSVVSSDELNCVVGKRARKKTSKRGRENTEDAPVISHGIKTITHKQTMQEYFAAKLSRDGTRHVDNSLMESDTLRTSHDVRVSGEECGGEDDSGGCGDGEEADLQPVTPEGDQCCDPRQKRRKMSRKQHKQIH